MGAKNIKRWGIDKVLGKTLDIKNVLPYNCGSISMLA